MSLRASLVTDLSSKIQKAAIDLEDKSDPVGWIEREFYIPETRYDPKLRGRIQLMKYHRDVLKEALSRDEEGNYKYSIIVWSDIKKSAKSTLAAAVNLARANFTEWGEFYVVANDLKQADSRVAHYLRRAIELNPRLKETYRHHGYRTTSPSGSYIEAIPIDPSGEAGTNADQVTFCLDEQTEILTKDGWKGWETLSKIDYVATRNKEGFFEWQKPRDIYCGSYQGEMVKIDHRSMSALVTPDHRMYGKFVGGRGIAPNPNNSFRHSFVDELPYRFLESKLARETVGYFPVITSAWNSGKRFIYTIPATYAQVGKGKGLRRELKQEERKISSALYAEFMGWYLSEGCVIKKRGKFDGFMIAQSKKKNPKNHAAIIELLEEMGFTPRLWKLGIVVYHSEFAKVLAQYGLSGEKYIPDEIKDLPVDELNIFLKAYIDGDGAKVAKGGYLISSKSKMMRDDLTEIAQKCGYGISTNEYIDSRWKQNPVIYSIYLKSKSSFKRLKIEKKNWSKVYYSGMVFCPSTDNGVIYVRRNGTYWWTGNSELWGANETAKQRMWSELTIPPGKHGKAFRWVESYAGFAEESELLYSLWTLGVKQGEMLWPDRPYKVTGGSPTPLELYVNKDARMLCLWNTQPRCPWQTKDYYKSEEQILLPNEFLRMHRNQWVSSTETFVPMEWFDACKRDNADWPKIDISRQPVIIAMDAGVSGAAFGMFAGCRHPQRPDEVLTLYSKKWEPPKGGKIDYQGTPEAPGPELELRRLIKTYNIIQVAYDEFQLHDMATRLKKEGLAWFRAFPQVSPRLIADSLLRDLIRERRFWHRGEADLREHVQNADAKIDPEDHKVRLVKRAEKLSIDVAVCASMCSGELMRLNL